MNDKYFIFAISLSIRTLSRMPLLPMLSSNQLTTSTQRQQTARFTLTECLDCGNIMSVLVVGVLPSPPQRTGKQFAQQTVIFVCVFFVPSLAEAPVQLQAARAAAMVIKQPEVCRTERAL